MKPEMKFWTIHFDDEKQRVEGAHLGNPWGGTHWLFPAWIKAPNTDYAAGYGFSIEEYHDNCKASEPSQR